MAKLNKMELTALAIKILKDINDVQLPILLAKWEEKEREIEILPAFVEYKAWLERYPEMITGHYLCTSLQTVKLKLGLPSKPGLYSCHQINIDDVINSLIIAQITDTNMVDIIEQVKQSFLTTTNN